MWVKQCHFYHPWLGMVNTAPIKVVRNGGWFTIVLPTLLESSYIVYHHISKNHSVNDIWIRVWLWNLWLVGGWPTPLKNMSSSVGMTKFATEWKVIKFHGSKPPTKWIWLWRWHDEIKTWRFLSHFWLTPAIDFHRWPAGYRHVNDRAANANHMLSSPASCKFLGAPARLEMWLSFMVKH